MKTAGAILLMLTFTLSGAMLSQTMIRRVNILKKLSLMLGDIKTALQFSCPKVDVLINDISNKKSYSELSFLRSCVNKINSGEDFPTAWKTALMQNKISLILKNEEIQTILSFGESLGTTALEGQISICDMYKSMIDESLLTSQNNNLKYSKILIPLGFLLGLAAAVIVI